MVTLDEGGAGIPYLEVVTCRGRTAELADLSWVQHPVPARSQGWRIVPDTHPHLIHHRLRDGRSRTVVVGARAQWIDVAQDERAFTVGVRLRPGVLPPLLGVDAWELRDRSIAVCEVLRSDGRALAERVAEAARPDRARRLLIELVEACPIGGAVDWRVRGLLAHLSRRPHESRRDAFASAARALGLSERSLRDVCRAHIGLRPREAHRILRLHRALEAALLASRSDAAVAATAGYADQPHLIRESNALLGTTPAAFRSRGRADSYKTPPSATR